MAPPFALPPGGSKENGGRAYAAVFRPQRGFWAACGIRNIKTLPCAASAVAKDLPEPEAAARVPAKKSLRRLKKRSVYSRIKNTIKICKDNNTLKEYLEHRETEVEGIMLTLFDQDRITELYHKEIAAEAKAEGWAEGRAEGKAEGISEGMAKGKIEGTIHTLKELVKDGFITVTVAAKRAGMTEEAFRKIAMM